MDKTQEKIRDLIKIATLEKGCVKSTVSFFKAYVHLQGSPNRDRILKPAPYPNNLRFSIYMVSYDSKNEAHYAQFTTEAEDNLGYACQDYLLKLLPRIVNVKMEFDVNREDLVILHQTPEELKSIYDSLFPPVKLTADDFSADCFGEELAIKTAGRLKLGHRLENIHQDYCGTGLRFYMDQYDYIEINNQQDRVLKSFPNENDFIIWLSEQSNRSLARLEESNSFLHGNQVINKQRLLEFVSIN
jgi:hypothetical protein